MQIQKEVGVATLIILMIVYQIHMMNLYVLLIMEWNRSNKNMHQGNQKYH